MLYPGKKLARIQVESCPFESHSSHCLGLKCFIPGFSSVGNFVKYTLFGCLDLSRDCFGYSKQSEDLW